MKPITAQLAISETLAVDRSSRTISGVICFYDRPTDDRRGLVIKAGAITPRQPLDRVKLLRDHDPRDPIGYMTALDPKTLTATFAIPEGENGDRALTEAESKLRDGFSVGLTITEHSYDDKTDNVVAHQALLNETSLCAIPAFIDAGVQSVTFTSDPTPITPTKETPVTAITADQLEAALDAQQQNLERAFETRLADALTGEPSGPTLAWDTPGEFLQALARKEQPAIEFYAAYEGGKIADTETPNTWIADVLHFVEQKRPITGLFQQEVLPDKGMTMEYLRDGTDTTKVEEQENEGDKLKFGKITLDSDAVPIKTYGGATSLSRQVIERANAAYVTTTFRAMARAYARQTELATRAGVRALITEQIAADNKLTMTASPDSYDWLDLVVDAADLLDERGFSLDGLLVSKDVFKKLLRLESSGGDSLVSVSGQSVNQVGTINLTGLVGDLASVKFRLFPGAAAGTAAFYDTLAYTTWENRGAPLQLTDSKPVELVEEFAYYGYQARASQYPKAILPVEGITA
ncbi:HK97 family phage prohead protease [Leucobacter chironomi]|uniref:phage major capsid protein n=1 Tax=Leucobacter chironomi TaxID=491918 RepID=UPI0004232018|nr:HK97 family phage prohead protease [Leucobacter chironomi]